MIVMNNLSYCLNQDFSNDSVMKLTLWKAKWWEKSYLCSFTLQQLKKFISLKKPC